MEIGLEYTAERAVTEKDGADAMGSGLVPVFATPAMILLMEEAAYMAVQPALPKGSTTVGTVVNVRHLAATPIGMKVKAMARLVEIDGRRLIFDVEALDENGVIGTGRHERAMIDVERFLTKLAN